MSDSLAKIGELATTARTNPATDSIDRQTPKAATTEPWRPSKALDHMCTAGAAPSMFGAPDRNSSPEMTAPTRNTPAAHVNAVL